MIQYLHLKKFQFEMIQRQTKKKQKKSYIYTISEKRQILRITLRSLTFSYLKVQSMKTYWKLSDISCFLQQCLIE